MPESRRETTIAFFCAMVAMLCASSVPVFLRHLTGYLDSWTTNAIRYSVSAAFWLPFVVVLGRRMRQQPAGASGPLRSVWLVALIPFAPNVLAQVGWAVAPYYVEASTIGFVIRTSFLFTVALGFVFLPAERPLARSGWFYAGAAGSLAGVLLMYAEHLWSGRPERPGEAMGLVILLATACGYAIYGICVRRFLVGYPLRLAFGVVSLYTSACLVALMLIFGDYGRVADVAPREWVLLIVSGFLGIAFAHVLSYRAIHGIGPVLASGVSLMAPFCTYLLAALVLGEKLSGLQLLGGLAVVSGGFLLIRAKAGLAAKVLIVPPKPS